VAALIASTTIPDIEGDRDAGLNTTGVVLGDRRTSLLAVVLMAAALVLGLAGQDVPGAAAAALGLALLLVAHATGTRSARVASSQGTVAAYTLAFGIQAPYVLLLLALAFLGSRAYYGRRFGITHPGR
jgi:4-hydroxybenzoate polyprenyltransferase